MIRFVKDAPFKGSHGVYLAIKLAVLALGLVLLTAALICQFTSITNTHIGR